MFKSAGLLLGIAGLALGLWIGYNPQMHREALQHVHEVRAAYLEMKTDATLQIQKSTSWISSGVHIVSKGPDSGSRGSSLTRITAGLSRFWDSVRSFWARVTAQARLSR
jgi:hypothetical protein